MNEDEIALALEASRNDGEDMKKRKFKKKLLGVGMSVAGVILVGVAVCAGMMVLLGGDEKEGDDGEDGQSAVADPRPDKPDEVRIKVAAMGDMLSHASVVANAKVGDSYDFAKYFADIRPLYEDANVVFCNQEALSSGAAFGITGYPSFNAPLEFADGLSKGAGCNVIALANNHMGDKSAAAINATLDKWDSLDALAVAGANRSVEEQRKVRYFTVKGVKFAFLAFADYNNNRNTPEYAVNLYRDAALFDAQLAEARTEADVVMVSMHWGVEDSATVSADQKAQVEKMKVAGVDVVIGTGPHVLQKVEKLVRDDDGEMLVWYSIGNMLNTQLDINGLTSCVAGFEIVKGEDGKIKVLSPSCAPTYMSYSWTAAEKAAENLLARKDLRLQPLRDAGARITEMHFSDTVEGRLSYIRSTLGELVEVR